MKISSESAKAEKFRVQSSRLVGMFHEHESRIQGIRNEIDAAEATLEALRTADAQISSLHGNGAPVTYIRGGALDHASREHYRFVDRWRGAIRSAIEFNRRKLAVMVRRRAWLLAKHNASVAEYVAARRVLRGKA